ncbi:MAG TPA: sigma-70 family RNA polymerase sigma factor, partial [Acidimicrobiales bacterium]|nr:sigma-70 family RNA polymerase sigma factor [Acidimicrobiales bacterium]
MAAAQAGDRNALDTLLRRHHDRLWALCRRLAGNHADAEDALQDALIAIARGIRSYDGRAAFTTWSYRVATNACLDELRRRRRRPQPEAPESLTPGQLGPSGAATAATAVASGGG